MCDDDGVSFVSSDADDESSDGVVVIVVDSAVSFDESLRIAVVADSSLVVANKSSVGDGVAGDFGADVKIARDVEGGDIVRVGIGVGAGVRLGVGAGVRVGVGAGVGGVGAGVGQGVGADVGGAGVGLGVGARVMSHG